jgi:uncharacterized protein involved in exopolysaccharide biosynthesis
MTPLDSRLARDRGFNGAQSPPPLTLLGITNVVLRNRRLVLAVVLLVTVVAVLRTAMAPRTYSSSATFIPAGRKAPSAASGLAAQFGISVAGGDNAQSPDFYMELLHSRAVQDDVLLARYVFPTREGRFDGTLLDYYGGASTPAPRRRAIALRTLDDQINTGTSIKTGTVMLRVNCQSPLLAGAIATNLLSALERFNRSRWQQQSQSERRFSEEQVAAAASDLRAAEDRLQIFQEQNRDYSRSPHLTFEHDRIIREVAMRQALYTSLSQSYAQARIDAVRENPSVTVIESPEVPTDPEPRGLARTGVLALMAGLFLSMLLAFLREHVARTRQQHPDENEEYITLRQDAARDLRNPLRLLKVPSRPK